MSDIIFNIANVPRGGGAWHLQCKMRPPAPEKNNFMYARGLMKDKLIGKIAIGLGMIVPGLLALGTWLPTVKTTLGYSYNIVGNNSLIMYGISVVVLAFNVMLDKMPNSIARRLNLVVVAILAGCAIYGVKISNEGAKWFTYQIAFDAPGWPSAQKDAYWGWLSKVYGENATIFGNLRHLYEGWGPNVEVNDEAVFQNAINSLTEEQAKQLITAAGINYSLIPEGVVAYFCSLFAQICLLLLLRRRTYPLAPSTDDSAAAAASRS